MRLCHYCSTRCCVALGYPADKMELVLRHCADETNARGSTNCEVCLDLCPMVESLSEEINRRVRTSPYTDSTEYTLNLGAPRVFTLTWFHALWRLDKLLREEGADLPARPAFLPDGFENFKDVFGAKLKTSLNTLFGRVDPSPGATCNQSLTQSKTVDPEKGIVITVTVLQYDDEDVLAECLPTALHSNRCDAPLSWAILESATSEMAANLRERLLKPLEPPTVEISITHAPILLCGRYLKMLRDISQSPWFTDGKRVGSASLQEMVADPILPFVYPSGIPSACVPPPSHPGGRKRHRQDTSSSQPNVHFVTEQTLADTKEQQQQSATTAHSFFARNDLLDVVKSQVSGFSLYKFHAAGREDVDVRMLGNGRPFVLELLAPHRERFTAADFRAMEDAVNSSEGAEICDLTYAESDAVVKLARHSEAKRKSYRCVVWCSRALTADDPALVAANAVKDLPILQKTPIRVLHRRSLLERPRTIHSMTVTLINPHWMVVDLETQAGTYVKEFVHGDLGRTVPHLGTLLGGTTDIIQLDVTGMVMDTLK